MLTVLTVVRSLLYNLLALLWTATLALLGLPSLVLPPAVSRFGGRLWTGGLVWLARVVCGVRWRVVGLDRLPPGACIVAARHESAWDTFFFHRILPRPAYVMKKELLRIPVVGAHMRRAGNIAIDRAARVQALHILIDDAARALADGCQIIVFPEGTRMPPGESRPYHAGVAALYDRCNVPVVPVALNSGRLWARRSFIKKPGTIVVEILEPIAPGLDRRSFLVALRDRIETACARLAASGDAASGGCGQSPDTAPGKPGETGTSH